MDADPRGGVAAQQRGRLMVSPARSPRRLARRLAPVQFLKGHGTGNDFVLLPGPRRRAGPRPPSWSIGCATVASASAPTASIRVVPVAAVPEVA